MRVRRQSVWALAMALAALCAFGVAQASDPQAASGDAVVERADRIKGGDFKQFSQVIARIDPSDALLSDEARWKVRYLLGWRAVYLGHYDEAQTLLDDVAENAPSTVLRFRASATLVNLLGEGHRYEKAFQRLTQMEEMLPSIRDPAVRFQGLGEAAQLLGRAGQFEQAEAYARTMMADPPPGQSVCMGTQHLLRIRRDERRADPLDPVFQRGIDACVASGNELFAEIMRADLAAIEVDRGHGAEAVALLEKYGDAMRRLNYSTLSAEMDSTLAQAYLQLGRLKEARQAANSAIGLSVQGEYTEAMVAAYAVLYRVEKQAGNVALALGYHEQLMAADKAYLTDVSARSLAYQMVDQQVMSKKNEVDALNKQNEILRLRSALDRKDAEAGRLYIFVLLLSLVAIVWLLLWLRRSQLRFMKLARRDGLTGICNREHFVEQAERVLAYGARSDRGLCLVLFDLDHFKSVNDTYGHATGDDVLKRAVDVCRRSLHACDVFGRLGGEEFAVLLPDCDPAQARARAEQLRLSIAATAATPAHPLLQVTASFGVASTLQCGYELHRLLVVADAALYRGKRAGRNCVFMGDTGDIPDSPYLMEARG